MCDIYILGPSGFGKTLLAKLLKLAEFSPKRVRKPRTPEEISICIDPEKFKDTLSEYKKVKSLFQIRNQSEVTIAIHTRCSFLQVRDKQQLLIHPQTPIGEIFRKIELYAPRLQDYWAYYSTLCKAEKTRIQEVTSLRGPEKAIVIILNSTNQSIREMNDSTDLKLATLQAIRERSQAQGKRFDLAKSLRRVENLPEELVAWKDICNIPQVQVVECKKWPHFEYRYYSSHHSSEVAKNELILARSSFIGAIERDLPRLLVDKLTTVIRTPIEILKLTDIV